MSSLFRSWGTPAAGSLHIGTAAGVSAWGNELAAASAAATPFMLKGAASQSADLLQVLKASGAVLARVRAPAAEGGLHHVVESFLNAAVADHFSGYHAQLVARGTTTSALQLRTIGYRSVVSDEAAVANVAVSGAANNGAGLIRITTGAAHGYATGDKIAVYGVTGTTEANGAWAVTVIDATNFDLQGSTFANAYVSGGTATNRPMLTGFHAAIGTRADRGSLTGTALHGDDVVGVSVQNTGTGKGTDAFYLAASSGVAGSAWATGYAVDANVDSAFYVGARSFDYGLNLRYGTFAQAAILLPNNVSVSGRNAAGSADVALFKIDGSNRLAIQANVLLGDGVVFHIGTTTGTKIGTSTSNKIGFWNATPAVQPTNIVDADGTLADITTKFNLLLTKLETIGLLAAS